MNHKTVAAAIAVPLLLAAAAAAQAQKYPVKPIRMIVGRNRRCIGPVRQSRRDGLVLVFQRVSKCVRPLFIPPKLENSTRTA